MSMWTWKERASQFSVAVSSSAKCVFLRRLSASRSQIKSNCLWFVFTLCSSLESLSIGVQSRAKIGNYEAGRSPSGSGKYRVADDTRRSWVTLPDIDILERLQRTCTKIAIIRDALLTTFQSLQTSTCMYRVNIVKKSQQRWPCRSNPSATRVDYHKEIRAWFYTNYSRNINTVISDADCNS